MLAYNSRKFGPQWDVHLPQLLFAYLMTQLGSLHSSWYMGGMPGYSQVVSWIPTGGDLDTLPSPYLVDSGDHNAELARCVLKLAARSVIVQAQK